MIWKGMHAKFLSPIHGKQAAELLINLTFVNLLDAMLFF